MWLRCLLNGLSILEVALISGKWPKYLTHGLNMSENYCDVWEIAKIFVKWLIYMRIGLCVFETA